MRDNSTVWWIVGILLIIVLLFVILRYVAHVL